MPLSLRTPSDRIRDRFSPRSRDRFVDSRFESGCPFHCGASLMNRMVFKLMRLTSLKGVTRYFEGDPGVQLLRDLIQIAVLGSWSEQRLSRFHDACNQVVNLLSSWLCFLAVVAQIAYVSQVLYESPLRNFYNA